jgi:ABC-2 type transport system ATP-binding protein
MATKERRIMNTAVELKDLSKTFQLKQGTFFKSVQKTVIAVDNLSLHVGCGESVALIGPNGAGKSTTIKMLTGILKPSGGSASVLGTDPWRERSRLSRKIGVVFGQRSQLWYHLPPSDSFDLLATIYDLDRKHYKARCELLVDRFKLAPFWSTPVRKLSLGQRMRAEVAVSLLHDPEVLFLDEPTIGLDVIARQELRDLVREWNRAKGLTILLTSHDAGDIEAVCDRVVVINHGRIVLDGKVADVKREYLGAKVIHVVFHDTPQEIVLPGVKTLKAEGYSLSLECDDRRTPIQKVIASVMSAGSVADITIEDPPLEEVIAHIYGSKAVREVS